MVMTCVVGHLAWLHVDQYDKRTIMLFKLRTQDTKMFPMYMYLSSLHELHLLKTKIA